MGETSWSFDTVLQLMKSSYKAFGRSTGITRDGDSEMMHDALVGDDPHMDSSDTLYWLYSTCQTAMKSSRLSEKLSIRASET